VYAPLFNAAVLTYATPLFPVVALYVLPLTFKEIL
jgi:hypothetical protein